MNILLIFILQTLDIITTHYCLQTGYIIEVNPLMDYLFTHYPIITIISIKLVLTIIIILIGYKLKPKRMSCYLVVANIIMLIIVLHNTVSIFIVRNWRF